MTEEVVFRWISVLGFPIVAAIALAYAVYKIGWYLAGVMASHVETNVAEMKLQTVELRNMRAELKNICQARCPVVDNCDNHAPRDSGSRHGMPGQRAVT